MSTRSEFRQPPNLATSARTACPVGLRGEHSSVTDGDPWWFWSVILYRLVARIVTEKSLDSFIWSGFYRPACLWAVIIGQARPSGQICSSCEDPNFTVPTNKSPRCMRQLALCAAHHSVSPTPWRRNHLLPFNCYFVPWNFSGRESHM